MIVSIISETQKAEIIHNKAVSFIKVESLSPDWSQRREGKVRKALQMIESSE